MAAMSFKNWIDVTTPPYGARGDGATDDAAAIRRAIADCPPAGTLYLPPSAAGYAVSGGIRINKVINVVMDGPLLYTGTADETAFGYGTPGQNSDLVTLKLSVIRKRQSNWLNEASIGIQLINVGIAQVNVFQVNGFTIGVQAVGDGTGFTMNNIELNHIYNNKIGVDCIGRNRGWVTENLWLGGRFGMQRITNPDKSRYGVRLRRGDAATTFFIDHNVFLKPSFEMGQSLIGSNEAIPVLIEHGEQNEFLSCRNEDNNVNFARITGASRSNVFDAMSSPVKIDERGTDPSSIARTRIEQIYFEKHALVYHTGNLAERACYYDGARNVNLPGVHLAMRSNAIAFPSGGYSNGRSYISISNPDYVELTGGVTTDAWGVGVYADTKTVKRFVVSKDCEPGYGGLISIVPFDAAGSMIATAGAVKSHPGDQYTIWQDNRSLAFGNGALTTSSASNKDFFFAVSDAVKKVRVVLHNGSQPMRIRSFSIYAADLGTSSGWVGYEEGLKGANLALTPPTAGTWKLGRLLMNAAPATGKPVGWVNTPGGWKAFGIIS